MCSKRIISIAMAASSASLASAFVVTPPPAQAVVHHHRQQQQQTLLTTDTTFDRRHGTSLNLSVDPTQLSDALSSASVHVATVSADIDSIPTDEFGTVFAGGIAVMLGGVVSALVVGALLDSGDNYSSVIAESYEGRVTKEEIMADEEFWSKLTPEQQEEAKKLLGKVKESKERGGTGLPLVGEREEAQKTTEAKEDDFAPPAAAAAVEKKPKQEVSMFDDYE